MKNDNVWKGNQNKIHLGVKEEAFELIREKREQGYEAELDYVVRWWKK